MSDEKKINIFWFRRDLRLQDNAGLFHALTSGKKVVPLFIFDKEILDRLDDKKDARVDFIHFALAELNQLLLAAGSSLLVYNGGPLETFRKLCDTYEIEAVYTNHDYEPSAIARDERVAAFLSSKNISFHTFKDQCIFEKSEVVKDDGTPYTIYTPYWNKWKARLQEKDLTAYASEKHLAAFYPDKKNKIPLLKEIGFEPSGRTFSFPRPDETIISSYHSTRDFPAINGTTRMSLHLRFGTISVRKLARIALKKNETHLKELVWRDFYMMILFHFPYVVSGAFKKQYDRIQWRNNEKEFDLWCKGQTGYPIVDAGMRELNTTGFMHNRVRMIVASFLCKHLLIDWRWGEAYFAQKLMDFDLSANNGGWQWAAGSGCDAAPYFRVFSPEAQTKKFDAELKYIRYWVPEFESFEYAKPVVDHTFARERVLKVYKAALGT